MNEKLMTMKDVALYMQTSLISVRRMVARNELPHIRIGKGRGSIRIVPSELEKYVKAKSDTNYITNIRKIFESERK